MTRKFILVALCAAFALPAHAGQGTIQETDTQIIVEYNGGEDDVKAARAQEAEREAETKKKEAEEKGHQERMERAKRRATNRGIATQE